MKHLKGFCKILLIAAFWVALWALLAAWIDKPTLLPTPWRVLCTLFEEMQTATFYKVTATSLWNVMAGILIAVAGGICLSILTSYLPFLRELILPIMTVIKATPVASFIVLALIWIGSARVPTLITVLIVLPLIWTNLDVGFQKIDPHLREVARVYRIPFWKQLRILVFPSLKPYFSSAVRSSLGLAWKAGIAAEIIAMPRHSIGTMIGDAKQYIETPKMFAWTLTVILLSLVIELLFSHIFKQLDRLDKRERKEEVKYAAA